MIRQPVERFGTRESRRCCPQSAGRVAIEKSSFCLRAATSRTKDVKS